MTSVYMPFLTVLLLLLDRPSDKERQRKYTSRCTIIWLHLPICNPLIGESRDQQSIYEFLEIAAIHTSVLV